MSYGNMAVLPPPDSGETLSTAQVAAIAGCSIRQLQWWDEYRVLGPRRISGSSGQRREWSWSQAAKARFVAALRKRGMSLQSIRQVLRSGTPSTPGEAYGLVDSRQLSARWYHTSEAAWLALRGGSGGPFFVVRYD